MIRQLLVTFLALWVVEFLLFLAVLPVGGAAGTAGHVAAMFTSLTGAVPSLAIFNLAVACVWVLGGLAQELGALREQSLIEENILAGRICQTCGFYKKGWLSGTCRRTDEKTAKDASCARYS